MTVAMKFIAALALALALVLLNACASSTFSPSSSRQYPAFQGEVKVLKQLPAPGSYALIGIVRVEGPYLASDDRIYAQMKAQAAARGANAVVPQSAIKTQDVSSGGKLRILAAYAIRLRN